MKIGLDMMGGDFAPLEAVKGCAVFLEHNQDVHLIMIGDETAINKALIFHPIHAGNYTIVHASQVIEMHDHPTKALKEKKILP
jgi:glycerol-3-phosphate acyltransferase PlsX